MNWIQLDLVGCKPEQPARPLYETKVDGKRICLAYHRKRWYALDARCPHAGGPFADGHIAENGCVICPWHRFAFDLKTGQSDSGGYYVHTYPVRIQNGKLWIQMKPKKAWWKFW